MNGDLLGFLIGAGIGIAGVAVGMYLDGWLDRRRR